MTKHSDNNCTIVNGKQKYLFTVMFDLHFTGPVGSKKWHQQTITVLCDWFLRIQLPCLECFSAFSQMPEKKLKPLPESMQGPAHTEIVQDAFEFPGSGIFHIGAELCTK